MKHYGALLEAGSQIVSGNLTVNPGQDLTLSATSILNIGAGNDTGADKGLIIASATTNAYLDATGRERSFNLDDATAGIQALRVNGIATFDSNANVTGDLNVIANTTLTGNLIANSNVTIGDAAADLLSVGSANITLVNHASLSSIQGSLLGFNAAGQIGVVAPNSHSVHTYTGTATTDELVKADFITAFNTAGVAVGGITVDVGTTVDPGDIILLTNGATPATVEQYIYTGAQVTASANGANDNILDAEIVDVSHAGDVVENLTAGAGIEITGSKANFTVAALVQTDANSALENIIGSGVAGANGLDIADAGITFHKMAANSILNGNIADNAISNVKIEDNVIGEAKLAISNTAVVGQFLSATAVDANGQATLTWASPAGTVGKFAVTDTIAAATANPTITVLATAHGLGAIQDIIIQVYEVDSSNMLVIPDSTSIATNGDVTITFGTAALGTATSFRTVLVG